MAALSTDNPSRLLAGAKTLSIPIKNATQLYVGSFTSVLAGYAQPFAGAAGEMLVGRCLPTPLASLPSTSPSQLYGNTSPAAGIPVPEASICTETEILKQASVTGVSAQTSLGSVVFLNSNDNDLTLTRPARGIPFGIVTRWYSSTTCDVLRFSYETLCALALSGAGSQALLVMSGAITDLTTADFTIAAPAGGWKIRSMSATVVKACTTGATGSVTLQPKISGTLTTGGVVTINTTASTGGTAGDVCAGTAITAFNTGSESSTLKIAATLTSTFTAGSYLLFVTFDRQPTL